MRSRLTANSSLKRIGAGAFEYDFGALDDADNQLAKSYTDIMYGCPLLKVSEALTTHLVR